MRCRVGLHRWEHASALEGDRGAEVEIVRARCRDDCPRFGEWHVVERHPYDGNGREQPVRSAPESAPDASPIT